MQTVFGLLVVVVIKVAFTIQQMERHGLEAVHSEIPIQSTMQTVFGLLVVHIVVVFTIQLMVKHGLKVI